jgi:hypothetical protein
VIRRLGDGVTWRLHHSFSITGRFARLPVLLRQIPYGETRCRPDREQAGGQRHSRKPLRHSSIRSRYPGAKGKWLISPGFAWIATIAASKLYPWPFACFSSQRRSSSRQPVCDLKRWWLALEKNLDARLRVTRLLERLPPGHRPPQRIHASILIAGQYQHGDGRVSHGLNGIPPSLEGR